MTKPTSAFVAVSSRLKRAAPLPSPDDTATNAAYEFRECRTHSRRVEHLLQECWQGFAGEEGQCDHEAAQCLLAAVDDAARAARAMLQAMGVGGYVQEWEHAAAKFAAGTKPKERPAIGAYGPKGKR